MFVASIQVQSQTFSELCLKQCSIVKIFDVSCSCGFFCTLMKLPRCSNLTKCVQLFIW